MTRRRALMVGVLSLLVLALHVVLVRAMAHGHVAHVLLGSGNAAPPLGAALLAVSLVVVRLGAVVLAPGLLLASIASLAAHALVGPPRGGGAQRGAAGGAPEGAGTGTSSGAGKSSDDEGSGGVAVADGTGLNIEGRAT